MGRLTGAFLAVAILPVAALSLTPSPQSAVGSGVSEGLLAGCTDVPEAVVLVEELRAREANVARALAELDRQKADLALARKALQTELSRLKSAKHRFGGTKANAQKQINEDVARLVAVYEAMKPKEAAAVIESLPPDFSAELLARLSPETGARIIAAMPPDQGAILTTYMGARSAPSRTR